jgi:hypothetical protein
MSHELFVLPNFSSDNNCIFLNISNIVNIVRKGYLVGKVDRLRGSPPKKWGPKQ